MYFLTVYFCKVAENKERRKEEFASFLQICESDNFNLLKSPWKT